LALACTGRLRRAAFGALLPVLLLAGVAPAQDLVCTLRPSLDEVPATTLSLGFRAGAADGLDDLDVPAPPAAPGAALDAGFVLPDPDAPFPGRWSADYRAPAGPPLPGEVWQLVLATDTPGGSCRLDVSLTAGSALNLVLRVTGLGPAAQDVPVPGALSFPLAGTGTVLQLSLRSDGTLARRRSWGAVKALFR
jgi:hypothetical protein